jgi:hypothetical protein
MPALRLCCTCNALQGTLDAFRRIPREEGFRGFYKGVGPSVQRAAIINGCGIASYDHTKQVRGHQKRGPAARFV